MKPFAHISLPAPLSQPHFHTLVTVPDHSAAALLDAADAIIKTARRDWDALSKMAKEKARCGACEGAWRDNVRGVLRACIAAGIAVAALRRGLVGPGEEGGVRGRVRVEVPGVVERYHDWWVVPRVVVLG